MRVVSIGDLVTDYYYNNDQLLGVNGGMTSHNIIANLALMKIKTSVFGVCGDDNNGKVAIKSLEDIGVDMSKIEKISNVSTRCFYVSYKSEENDTISFSSKKRCPVCNEKNWYEESLISVEKTVDELLLDDIIVFDNLNAKNVKIITKTKNIKMLDLGQYFELDNFNDKELSDIFRNDFEIINLNQRVAEYLLNRYNFNSILELSNLLKTKMIIITNGKNGATFILNGKIITKVLDNVAYEKDSTGAGDAFFASFIKDYIINKMVINENYIDRAFINATKLTSKVVKKMGARGHINNLYKITKKGNYCVCQDYEFKVRKQIKRCNININNMEVRLINALNSNAYRMLEKIKFLEDENYLFVGTGGSYPGAKFASIVINDIFESNTYTMWPRDVLYRKNNKINKVFMFSYSGTTSDIIESSKSFKISDKYVITKGEIQNVVFKTGISKNNIISYRTASNKGKEKGFLSFEGAVAPAALFLKYYIKFNNINENAEDLISNSIKYWNNYYDEMFKIKEVRTMFEIGNLINIFTGDYTWCASLDIESKFIESGILNAIIHEKKNFSHGRFINYENLNNKNNIYFKQNRCDSYEEELLNYISKDKSLIIESRYNGILCEFDLLIASQLLIYNIGKILNIDVSKPKYSDDAMKIYFYKGNM